uniref:Uncharacterized protein n=1 Tax=Trichobilharzia regenti TaxID=157069 RepID=A0AA85JW83_TRIRE|nr:unnamed protein product [Trichobilharzia regenti]
MNTSYLSDAYDSFLNDIKQAKRRNNFSNTHILLNQNLSNTNDEGKNDKREFFNAHENETEYSGEEKDRMSVEEKRQLELDEKEEDEVSWLLNSEEILEDDEITERESVLDEDRASEVEKDVEQGKEGENLPENRQSEFSAEDRRQINLVLRQLERPPCILMPLYYLCRSCCSTLRQYVLKFDFVKSTGIHC